MIKGYLLEETKTRRDYFMPYMSIYYRYLFLISGLVVSYIFFAVLISLLVVLYPSLENLILSVASSAWDYIQWIVIILILSIHIMYFLRGHLRTGLNKLRMFNKDNFSTIIITSTLFLISLFIWLLLYSSLIHHPQGHITIDMESVYYKSDEQIPVLIQVTGPDTGLSVELFNTSKSTYLMPIASIDELKFYPQQKIGPYKNLIGDSLSSGKYIVYINTSNMPTGYYKLKFKRIRYNVSEAKGFYLANNKFHISRAAVAIPSSNM